MEKKSSVKDEILYVLQYFPALGHLCPPVTLRISKNYVAKHLRLKSKGRQWDTEKQTFQDGKCLYES